MNEKEYQEKMQDLERVKSVSKKLFLKTGKIAYYGAVCGARDLQREYYNEYNNEKNNGNISEK